MSDKESTGIFPPKISIRLGQPGVLGKIVFERQIPSDVALVHPLVVRVIESLRGQPFFPSKEESRIALCIEEALSNAVVHGNRKDFTKKVKLQVFLDKTEWRILVQDGGQGFDPEKLPDPLRPDSLWKESGRGIYLITHFIDRVEYFANGSTIVMTENL